MELGNNEKDKEKSFLFGLGIWSKGELKALNECTKSITIKEFGKAPRVIKDEELKNYLPQKRNGILNQWLKIVILKE